ncbi:MAG: F0F1 ATP synthase subunit delta [bacterium]
MTFTSREYAEALYESVRGLKDKETAAAVRSFVSVMDERGLSALLPAVLKELPAAAKRIDGVEDVTVEVAHEIDRELAERAGELVSAGRPAEIEVRVRPELLGGLRVRGRDSVYDVTLKGSLSALKEKFVRSS